MRYYFFDRVYGCLVGGGIGDALGKPTEGMSYLDIRRKHGMLETLITRENAADDRPGIWTDDTTLGSYIAYGIIRKGNSITAHEFANLILEKLDEKLFWVNEQIVKTRLKVGISPWEAGAGGIGCGCAAMGIAPVGIINAFDPEQAYQEAMCLTAVNSNGENRDFGAAFACAVASALQPDSTVQSVMEDVLTYGSDIVYRSFTRALNLAEKCSDTEQYTARFYETLLDDNYPLPPGQWKEGRYFSANGREYVPVSLALLKLSGADVSKAIIAGANFGRDCDSIASLTGQIGGAMYGAKSLRKEWIDTINEANRGFLQNLYGDGKTGTMEDAAHLLVEALHNKLDKKIKNIEAISKHIGSL